MFTNMNRFTGTLCPVIKPMKPVCYMSPLSRDTFAQTNPHNIVCAFNGTYGIYCSDLTCMGVMTSQITVSWKWKKKKKKSKLHVTCPLWGGSTGDRFHSQRDSNAESVPIPWLPHDSHLLAITMTRACGIYYVTDAISAPRAVPLAPLYKPNVLSQLQY